MKEIIKYLRTVNDFSQEEIASKLNLTRQSYIKYEKGTVIPSKKIIQKLAELYGVSFEFIMQNKLPQIANHSSSYNLDKVTEQEFSEPALAYSVKPQTKIFEAWYDGTTVRVNDPAFMFYKGQSFKIVIDENEAKSQKKKQKKLEAFDELINYIKKNVKDYPKGPNEDPYYKEDLMEALDEKYALIN